MKYVVLYCCLDISAAATPQVVVISQSSHRSYDASAGSEARRALHQIEAARDTHLIQLTFPSHFPRFTLLLDQPDLLISICRDQSCFVLNKMRLTMLSVSFECLRLQAVADQIVAKATDENLTSENWEYILVLYRSAPLEVRK